MNIAIDFDETYTMDPQFFQLVILAAKLRGHDAAFVTYRGLNDGNEDIIFAAEKLDIKIHFTDSVQKETYCRDIKWLPDIWIDDYPLNIPPAKNIKCKWDVLKDRLNIEE